ncbi:MAG: polyphosphate kinase 1 [Gemmatimonadetes bacterium]|nr:polyphosphate kinase 1 [Gemmatimonadota bacterium]
MAMHGERVLRFAVSDHETLTRISNEPLPLDLKEQSADLDFFRVVYFDTNTGDLERKGASVRLSIRPDETQTLSVDVGAAEGRNASVTRRYAEARVEALPPLRLFAGESEPARMIRALVDPAHLRPTIEIETVRRVRRAVQPGAEGDTIDFAFDAVTVRRGELSGDLEELEITIRGEAPSISEGLVEAVERAYGTRLILADTVARARGLLDHMMLERLERDVRAAREVAVIAHSRGRIALCQDGESLYVPTGHGSGQEACRRVLRSAFGRSLGRIRLLGTAPGMDARPGLEVWLAEGVSGGDSCKWLPIEVVLEHVGAPQLRDARTLAALHAVARSDLGSRQGGGANGAATGANAAYPIFERAVSAARVPALLESIKARDVPPELLLNPELSRLAFDERILVIAEDTRTPLLERVRFLSMFGARIDDFFVTRIAEFKKNVAEGRTETSIDGLTPDAELDLARIRARTMLGRAYRLLTGTLIPALQDNGIRMRRWADLNDNERSFLRRTYEPQAEAVLTPVIADPTHPFPHMRNLRPAIAALIRLPESTDEHFVAVELPSGMPRFVQLPDSRDFIPLEELILAWLPSLYPGLHIVQANTFRVARSAVMDFDDEPAGGVLAAIEEQIAQRPFGEVVRLEVERAMPNSLRDRLLRELQFELPEVMTGLSNDDVYPVDRLVDLAALRELGALDIPDLRFDEFEHTTPLAADRPIFDQVRERDVMVRFPFDSFDDTVERLLDEAADDPDVIAMKITLYRTDADSRLVKALARARGSGKDAFALVELKASFDERRNIEWARSLQTAGIHVVFSPTSIKVHAKLALIVRREAEGIRRYVYIGTGNLNAATARAYTDVGILTADPELAAEVNDVFNLLTGYSGASDFQHLLVSPFTMRDRFMAMIDREIGHAQAGRGGRIRIQLNGLADRRMIAALYRAAHEGVKIDMMVREICCLRPGVEGVSENIRVVSKLGRFLQHSRIYCFDNAGEPEYFIGSADWRPRNLSKRVEVITPVRADEHRETLNRMLDDILNDPDAWTLQSDGTYVRGDEVVPARGDAVVPG